MKQTVFDYIKKKYKVFPDYPWIQYDENAVSRHKDTRKWFALVMEVSRDKLGLHGFDPVDVINLKTDDPFFHGMLIQQPGIMPGYHMNKQHWISVLLDGTVSEEQVFDLIDMSFSVTTIRKEKRMIVKSLIAKLQNTEAEILEEEREIR